MRLYAFRKVDYSQLFFFTLSAGVGPVVFSRLQASEQYFTSSQFFAQLLRQVMSRPQATQGLLGSDDLLPLKDIAN